MVDININLRIPALEKLLEYVASGIGAVGGLMLAQVRAGATRKETEGHADALQIWVQGQANAMSLIQEARKEAEKEFSGGEISIPETVSWRTEIESRVSFQERKRQSNIVSIIRMTAEDLRDRQVEDHSIDHDWVAQYFDHIQDVTSEHMQRIWTKILSGEVETPGRTSLHTLAILKRMSQRDAALFESASRFVFDDFILQSQDPYVGNAITWGDPYEHMHLDKIQGIPTHAAMLQLASYGLFTVSKGTGKYYVLGNGKCRTVAQGNTLYKMSKEGELSECEIPCHLLTPQGVELYKVIEATIDTDYLHALARFLHDAHGVRLESAVMPEESESSASSANFKLVDPC